MKLLSRCKCEGTGIRPVRNGKDDYDLEYCICEDGVRRMIEEESVLISKEKQNESIPA